MVSIPGVNPIFMWIGFIVLVLIFLIVDLGLFHKKNKPVTVKEAITWTFVWIGLSLLFNLFIFLEFGSEPALKFLTGYLLEKSLSLDNIFVIFLIFASFKIEQKYQHKILFWGIIGALFMRGILIGLGSALVTKFNWIFYIFGIFLIYSGISMVFKKDEDYDPHETWVVRFLNKVFPVSRNHMNGKFFTKENGKIALTIIFVTLIVIEFTDVVFAFDSIPAIFGITTDPFIVFTSNIFAILGLRSLYFVIAKIHDMFVYLNYGLAAILVFIGIKMIVAEFFEIPLLLSLGIVFFLLFVSIIASITFGRKAKKKKISKKSSG